MSDVRRTAALGLALGGAAALGFWWLRSVARPFVYVTRTGAHGEERLHLARISGGAGKVPAVATTVRMLYAVPGEQPTEGVPERFTRLVPSPGNKKVAALAIQVGIDFVDCNIRVTDFATGATLGTLNEHRFSTVSKANCTSAKFDAFCASELASGTPPAVVAGYDWTVLVDGGAAILHGPELAWADDDTLIVAWRFDIIADVVGDLGEEVLRFRIVPGEPGYTQWTAPMPPAPPAGPLSIGVINRAHPDAILYKGQPLPFKPARKLPVPLPPSLKTYRRARMVAGLVG